MKSIFVCGISFIVIFVSAYCKKEQGVALTLDCQVKCNLEPNGGFSPTGTLAKYYFDQNEKKCKVFIWTSSGGVVPFETLADCENCGCD
jgi:Kunitz/Bovine pancreatic trypsin inhibitor domain